MSWAPFRAASSGVPAFPWTSLFMCCLLVVLAWPTLHSLFPAWLHHPDYSHGWLILPVTGWLYWKAQPWNLATQPMPLLGSATICAGGCLHLAAVVVPWPLLDYTGWFLMLRGVALAWWGRVAAARLFPVLAYAVLMFPWPTPWLNTLAMTLQNMIAHLAEVVLNILWVCHRRGHLLYLAGLEEPLSVAVECSGVRQMMVFLALSWLLAHCMQAPRWKRLVLVLVSVPLAIIANVLRVLLLATMARLLGPQSIEGWLHDAPMLVTLPVGAILLWWCYVQLNGTATVSTETPAQSARDVNPPARWLALITLASIVGLQFSLQMHLHRDPVDQLKPRCSLDDLPWKLGRWHGQVHPEAALVRQKADFADGVIVRNYSDQQGNAAAVYMVFSRTGRNREHHPEICLRDAGGAVELKKDRRSISLQEGTNRKAERFRYQRTRHERTVVYYWHYTIIPATNDQQSLLQRLHDQQYDRWPGITVQVQTNASDLYAWQVIETTLLPELDRWLQEHLPAGAHVCTDRLPVRLTHP